MPLNYEFKAKTDRPDQLEELLKERSPEFRGQDHQTDTYFNVNNGRLKLREGNIENALIHYTRADIAGAKQSDVILYQHQPDPNLKAALVAALGVKVVVNKQRRIYFIDNIKFHFDRIDSLGSFVEVEAIDKDGSGSIEKLKNQCDEYAELFGIRPEDYIAISYSDMILNNQHH